MAAGAAGAAGLKTIGPALRNAILVLVYFEFWQIRNQLVQKKHRIHSI